MGLVVRGLIKRGGVWWVRVVVPADVRSVIGKTELLESLGTGDDAEAVRLGTPVIAQFRRQIADARGRVYTPPKPDDRLTPSIALSRLEAWERREIREAEATAFNELPQGIDWQAMHRRSALMYALGQRDAPVKVEGFRDRLAEALSVPADHSALEHKQLQFWFREAWRRVERAKDRFASGDFSEMEDDDDAADDGPPSDAGAAPRPIKGNGAGKSQMTLAGLLDAFLAEKAPPEAADIKRAWRLFTEFVGEKTKPADVERRVAAAFLAELRKFPKTRKPEIVKLPFKEAIAAWDGAKIAPKTVWKTFGHIKRVFAYGQLEELIPKDPLAAVEIKKPTRQDRVKKRMEYDDDEIRRMFSCPMFTGFDGLPHWGYREKRGDQVVKDAKFWLPILALWHGGRQDEFASARLSEIKVRRGITYFDWKRRDLKTEESARELPIHPIMAKLGWDEYVADLKDKGEEYLFPDLSHDADKPKNAADRFSKWFGLWQDKNGFSATDYDFHAFRHTFKRACRDADVPEEIHHLITGHKGGGQVADDYGKGAAITTLARALAKVEFPTFPLATYSPSLGTD